MSRVESASFSATCKCEVPNFATPGPCEGLISERYILCIVPRPSESSDIVARSWGCAILLYSSV